MKGLCKEMLQKYKSFIVSRNSSIHRRKENYCLQLFSAWLVQVPASGCTPDHITYPWLWPHMKPQTDLFYLQFCTFACFWPPALATCIATFLTPGFSHSPIPRTSPISKSSPRFWQQVQTHICFCPGPSMPIPNHGCSVYVLKIPRSGHPPDTFLIPNSDNILNCIQIPCIHRNLPNLLLHA